MSYEPTPFGPAVGDELPVLIGPGGTEPPRLYLLARPSAGVVRVRLWAGEQWDAPVSREMDARELADELERRIAEAQRRGAPVTQSAYAVRLWLTGQGTASR